MKEMEEVALKEGLLKYPKPDIKFQYGTAGFRTKGDVLASVMYRMGCLAVLRSISTGGKLIGAMVTASHNPEEDNGIKLIEPGGEMLIPEWESHATAIANSSDQEIASLIRSLDEHIDARIQEGSKGGSVLVGRDTRKSSPSLTQAVIDGVHALGGRLYDIGEVSTPIVHWVVQKYNDTQNGALSPEWIETTSVNAYFDTLASAFRSSIGDVAQPTTLILDGANGIGAVMAERLAKLIEPQLKFDIRNKNGKLNYLAGADFVKTSQSIPQGIDPGKDRGKRIASIDGDADRVIYFYIDQDGMFKMLDGDRIAILMAERRDWQN
eukprot:TRINITY_DN8439_c0_g1_i3.p1 TRINITY_DN8439_c0_g1~~TRINITY_DN8439_c0_g1_i3.p1  ORF type:complete len:323 (-),score=84.96 TRINITY_DN8439_c0_g1_i3:236-1204(-)